MPAALRQPCLDVGGVGLHEFPDHRFGRIPVVEFLLEDGREDDEGLRGRIRDFTVLELPRLEVVADHLRDDRRRLVRVAAAEVRLGCQQLHERRVERLSILVVAGGGGAGRRDLVRGDPLAKHREVLPGVDGAADAELKLGEPAPQIVVFRIAADRGLENVVGLGHVLAGRVGRLCPLEQKFREFTVGLVILRPQTDVAGVEGHRLGRLPLLEADLGQFRQTAGVPGDLIPPQEDDPGEPADRDGEQDQKDLEIDPLHW